MTWNGQCGYRAEFQHKYGISYEAIELLMQDPLPSALPEELLSSGQRNRFRREFRAANSIPDPPRRERTNYAAVSGMGAPMRWKARRWSGVAWVSIGISVLVPVKRTWLRVRVAR